MTQPEVYKQIDKLLGLKPAKRRRATPVTFSNPEREQMYQQELLAANEYIYRDGDS